MARTNVFLGGGNSAPGFTSADFFGVGGLGTETVTFGTGSAAADTTVDQNVEGVVFGGIDDDYRFQQQGNQLRVYVGATLITTITVQDDANGTQLTFANGTVNAKVSALGMTLGTGTVPAAAPAAVETGLVPP
ncbi:MAG TPA: hypothetical protein VJM34_14620, partial [Novosphingobium sp.]|nr:hypothetical protein [Novosphingobium sp.]